MNPQAVHIRSADTGVSMVELVIALALGVVLSTAIVSAYLAGKRSFGLSQQLARLQENGRHALDTLARDLAMAGFYGAVLPQTPGAGPIDSGSCASGWALDRGTPLRALGDFDEARYAGSEPAFLDCVDTATVLAGTDLLAIKRTAGGPAILDGMVQEALTRSNTLRWYLRVRAGAQVAWERRSSRDLAAAAIPGDESYWRAVSRVYFVRAYAVTPGDAIPTLCAEELAGRVMAVRCLVEGVEDFQLEFGIDTDGDGIANRFRPAEDSLSLAQAVSVRIYLLTRSLTEIPGHRDERDYILGSKRYRAAGDGFARSMVQTTVALDARVRELG